MAKIKKFPITHSKGIPPDGHLQFPIRSKTWLEDKTKAVRKFIEPQASRFARTKRSQRKVRAVRSIGVIIPLIIPLSLALIILLLGISLFLPKNNFQKAKERLAKNPTDFEAHLILAEIFLDGHQLPEAENELLLAENSQSFRQPDGLTASLNKDGVLGATASKISELWQRKKESDPEDIRFLIDQWERIISRRPDYRDGYLQLAVLNYQISDPQKAKQYLDHALALDPNFGPAEELGKIIQ